MNCPSCKGPISGGPAAMLEDFIIRIPFTCPDRTSCRWRGWIGVYPDEPPPAEATLQAGLNALAAQGLNNTGRRLKDLLNPLERLATET